MRNLALQGEVRHSIPAFRHGGGEEGDASTHGSIVAVIQNAGGADLHIAPDSFDPHYSDGHRASPEVGGQPKLPPVSFVVTSAGRVLALDANDRLSWTVDLEKVVEDSNEDSDEEDAGGVRDVGANDAPNARSEWFYAASFVQENAPDDDQGDAHVMGMNLAGEGGLHLTCLSREGHVVSISIDDVNTISTKGGAVEEGGECIGSFDNGLECGGWSPDGEVLALVTFASDEDEDGNEIVSANDPEAKVPILMTMNTQYEILSEVRLDPCLFRDNDANGNLHPNAISLCWRPDSSSLAVSTMDADVNGKPLRRIRTYHRSTLQILSLSKEEDGAGRDVPNLLPVAPTWAPAGCSHYVGAVQSSRPLTAKSARARQVSMQVAFLEPNGLRHRECKMHNTLEAKTDKEDIQGVQFNLEGDLLAVSSRVTSTDAAKASYQYGKVQFYHRSNYHWYLKHEMRYDGASGSSSGVISALKFSEEDPYRIVVALDYRGNGPLQWREYSFRWESSTVYYRNDPSTRSASVIAMAVDGKKLNFTPLDKAVIPPPMYADSLELPAPVVGITTRPCFCGEEVKEGRVEYIIALSDGKLALLQSACSGKNGSAIAPGFQAPSLLATVNPFNVCTSEAMMCDGFSLQGLVLRDITIVDADSQSLTIAAIACPEATLGKACLVDNLVEIKLSWSIEHVGSETSDATPTNVAITSFLPLEGRALRMVNWSDTAFSAGARGSALLELADGTLLEYSKGGIVEPCDAGPLLEPCPWVAGIYDAHNEEISTTPKDDDGEQHNSSKRLVIGLSSRYRLYCGERLLSSASSSFDISLRHRFVSHVTIGSRPHLNFLPLASLRDFDPLMGSDENMTLEGYEPRSVERGARLVAIFPTKPTLIIQMPRGNLETISPRALVLPYIMERIQRRDFRTSLDIMRRQRVDMNLIADLDPSSFLEKGGAEQFIGQIEKIDNINLFLSSLIDVDTTLWKYPVPSWIQTKRGVHQMPNPDDPANSKVNRICRKIRQVMLDAEKDGATPGGKTIKEGHYLLPTLSTFAKESPPKLEEALSLIKNSATRVPSKQSKRKSVLLSEHVQSSIQYLAFLADYELIFNTAIGMYDFDLAKAVARHSQMDPKIYLPMLKRWRELPESSARYEVDVKLKRFESALRHLVAAGQAPDCASDEDHFSKCLTFIEEHSLHKLGLELFISNKSNHRAIMISLGERLLSERNPEEALMVFMATNPRYLDGGKRASRACGDWRTYFACCAEAGESVGSEQISAMSESISSKVCNMREQRENYASAATILLDYGQDVADAVDMLISAHMWSEGRRVAHLYGRTDLVKKVVDSSVSYARTTVEDLAERATTFVKANDRYAEVIVLRRDAIREAEEAGDINHDDSASMFSMQSTASNTSLRSSASGSSVGSVGSVGSVASVSTVISVGATSTFSFTGEVDSMKHKSKFNMIGRDKKKKKRHKKKGPAARRMKPGSEEELKELILTLEHSCPDEHYVDVINETIAFLLQSDKQSMAILLFESYTEMESTVAQSQTSRLERDEDNRVEREKKERKEGRVNDFVEHPCEEKINAIRCKPLQESLKNALSFLN